MDAKYQQAIQYWTLAQPTVSAYVAAVVRDFRDRDDVLQAISIAILESFDSYDPSRHFINWAMGIARNQVGTYLRERRRNRLVFDLETMERLAIAFEDMDSAQDRSRDYLQNAWQSSRDELDRSAICVMRMILSLRQSLTCWA